MKLKLQMGGKFIKNYEIERSGDGRSYITVGTFPALYNNIGDGD